MGAVIKAVATSVNGVETSYLNQGSEAVRQCLEREPGSYDSLDLLINAGIYPDNHIHEPAFASMIQGQLSQSHAAQLSSTFSFDLHNGGGGSLMALSIISGFIESGRIRHGVVVAGDSKPPGSPAGAVMIGKGAATEGFQAFSQDTYTEHSGDYRSYSDYTGKELKTFINQEDTYLSDCLLCVEKSVDSFLTNQAPGMAGIDLIIPCQSPAGFVSGLADLYGKERLIELNNGHPCYSAGLILALELAHSKGSLEAGKKILFINVGPGIIVDLALYANPGRK
ncbi:MAG: hypothetical protein ABFS28_13300 [Bacteroidota bacterium]